MGLLRLRLTVLGLLLVDWLLLLLVNMSSTSAHPSSEGAPHNMTDSTAHSNTTCHRDTLKPGRKTGETYQQWRPSA